MLTPGIASDQFVESGLEHRPVLLRQAADNRGISIEANHIETAPGDGRCRDEPEMRHAGETYDRLLHRAPPEAIASVLRRCSTRWSQMSLARSVFAPEPHRLLKCVYSSSQVGSSWTRVQLSSGGRPLG